MRMAFGDMRRILKTWRCGVLAVLALLAGATAALGHHKGGWTAPEEARKLKNPAPVNETTLAAGKAVYLDKCAKCHGENGDGKGDEASLYSVPPSDFTDAGMMNEMTDGEIFWKMSEGRRPMPAFKKQLTEEQRWQLVHYLRTCAKKPAPPPKK